MSSQRVLVVRIGAMGDVLHALPAVAGLRQLWPTAAIEWVVDPRWAPLLVGDAGEGPVVSRVHLAATRLWSRSPVSGRTLRSVLTLRRSLKEHPFDFVVDMQGTLRSAVVASFAGQVAGYADPREGAARWFYTRKLHRRGVHVVDQGAALLGEALGVALAPAVPLLPQIASADTWADALLQSSPPGQRVALLAPTAGWGAKQWPAQRYGGLARALRDAGWSVLINASSADDPTCAAVMQTSDGAGSLVVSDLAQLIALLRRVDLVVGGDTGPVHLAAALGRPVVGLYGPTDPARNGPWGPGPTAVLRDGVSVTSYRHTPAADPGLERMTVEQVLDAVVTVVPLGVGRR